MKHDDEIEVNEDKLTIVLLSLIAIILGVIIVSTGKVRIPYSSDSTSSYQTQ
jgi:hypothetical protein